MGMFDEFYIENAQIMDDIKRITKEDIDIHEFQTKDLENMLASYRLHNGKLEAEKYLYRKAKRSEQTKFSDKLYLPLAVKVHKGWRTLDLTTSLNVYTSTDKHWIDVYLEFFRGTLKSYRIYVRNNRSKKMKEKFVEV